MARKSRRTDAAGAAPGAKAGVCRMGVYARTSKSYGDDGSSIGNQKRIVADHIDGLPDAVVAGYYVDDGFTGTNQDRDAFRRMVEDLREGRIDGIAAKDASRLGRDYVECQSFIRNTLPSLGARLILVADGVDSKDDAALDSFGLDVKSLLNSMYSRDLSRKIHATFDAARRRGALVLGNIPYGYLRDEQDAHHLVPDPATAPFVREMFRMKAQGASNAKIAEWLNDAGAPTAGKAKYERAGMEASSKDSRLWHSRNVNRMLANPVYAGRVVMGKWTQKLYLGIPHARNASEEWVVLDGAHEPLADPGVFDSIAREREERVARRRDALAATEHIRNQHPDRLPGKMRCGICGATMHICRWSEDGVFWGAEYMCSRNDAGEGGGRHRIAVPLVETVCMDVIRSQMEQRLAAGELVSSKAKDGTLALRLSQARAELSSVEDEIGDMEEKAMQLKSEHSRGEVSSRDYRRIERMLWSRLADAKARRDALAERRDLLTHLSENGAESLARDAAALVGSFSEELADAVIESVTYEGPESVSVKLRLTDAYRKAQAVREVLS